MNSLKEELTTYYNDHLKEDLVPLLVEFTMRLKDLEEVGVCSEKERLEEQTEQRKELGDTEYVEPKVRCSHSGERYL
jgi:hypothetical protein